MIDWQKLRQDAAIIIGDDIYRKINAPDWAGTSNETGYILMLFNVQNHNGKASFLAYPDISRDEIKQLLQHVLDKLDNIEVVER
jgi:hypothetical protein